MLATCIYCASKYTETIRIIEDTKSKIKDYIFYAGINNTEIKHTNFEDQYKYTLLSQWVDYLRKKREHF